MPQAIGRAIIVPLFWPVMRVIHVTMRGKNGAQAKPANATHTIAHTPEDSIISTNATSASNPKEIIVRTLPNLPTSHAVTIRPSIIENQITAAEKALEYMPKPSLSK